MSEYQYVHFVAIDRPLDDKEIEYMQRQSTRARITRRQFTNEYHFGDFRGNAKEMLRRGYDIHLHYANFGIRTLMIRLPAGLPCDAKTFKSFRVDNCLEWHRDKSGPGGILEISPEADAGTYDEEYYDANTLLRPLVPLRAMLIEGDLRPLYLAWLASGCDDEAMEPPVPAGLNQPTASLKAMARLYEVRTSLIAAAARCSPPAPKASAASPKLEDWVAGRSAKDLQKIVVRLLSNAAARLELLAEIRKPSIYSAWPTVKPSRTIEDIRKLSDELQQGKDAKALKAAAAARVKHLAKLAADPHTVISQAKTLVKKRSETNYKQAAAMLVDLREALGPKAGPERVNKVAEEICGGKKGRNKLSEVFRKHGLLV